jgi:hypothetical protein
VLPPEAAALADSLDTLVSGMFIVSGTGRTIHATELRVPFSIIEMDGVSEVA